MARGRKGPAGHRGSDSRDQYQCRGSDDAPWDIAEDPLRDLRPGEEDPQVNYNDDYIWPELDDNDEDD